jgi:hypothetical protein
MSNRKIKLSSNATFFYKYFIPLFFGLSFVIFGLSIPIDFLNLELSVRVSLSFFSFVFCLFMIPLINLHFVSYNDRMTIIKGFKKEQRITNKQILKVKRFMFYFYRIIYKVQGKTKKVIFLPHIFGVFVRFGGKPKSIAKYELLIK